MDSAGIPWYSTGTVNVTQGSSNVAGVGTNWVNAGLKVGDIFTIDKSRLYQITAVNSNTSLSLQEAYQGATGSSQVYFVIRNFAGTMQAQIAAQVSELVNKYESYIDTELKQITGPAGPTSFPYRGTWTTGRSYNGLDVVQYGDQLYMALYGHTSTSANAPGATGTAWKPLTITASGDIITTTFGLGSGYHNSIFGGRNLGSTFTEAQSTTIRNGEFNNIFIGDYWTDGNILWRVADIDYFYRTGDEECTSHHLVIIPNVPIGNAPMNTTDTNAGGYLGSEMRVSSLTNIRNLAKQFFGENHILTHRENLPAEITNGKVTRWEWSTCDIEIMSLNMVLGSSLHDCMENITSNDINYKQLALFRYRPDLISNRSYFWLRDAMFAQTFIFVSTSGAIKNIQATFNAGIRPYFLLY